jgi:hypothetical protein
MSRAGNYGLKRTPRIFHWIFVDYCGLLWIIMEYWNIVEYYWIIMEYWNTVEYYWIIVEYCEIQRNINDFCYEIPAKHAKQIFVALDFCRILGSKKMYLKLITYLFY